jgi:hypothetical protein
MSGLGLLHRIDREGANSVDGQLNDIILCHGFLLVFSRMTCPVVDSERSSTQAGMLFFVGTISMNPQMPVGFQAIVDNYFGVVLALVLSLIVQRLLWPVLRQREICRLFAEYFACCRKLLGTVSPTESEHLQSRLALIAPEIASWIRATASSPHASSPISMFPRRSAQNSMQS